MNILSLVSQNLNNFYQIQTKCYRNSDTVFFSRQFTKLNEASVRSDPLLAAGLYRAAPTHAAEAEAEAVAEREDPDSSACLHMHAVTMIVRLI
jgi:hypothetical protein